MWATSYFEKGAGCYDVSIDWPVTTNGFLATVRSGAKGRPTGEAGCLVAKGFGAAAAWSISFCAISWSDSPASESQGSAAAMVSNWTKLVVVPPLPDADVVEASTASSLRVRVGDTNDFTAAMATDFAGMSLLLRAGFGGPVVGA